MPLDGQMTREALLEVFTYVNVDLSEDEQALLVDKLIASNGEQDGGEALNIYRQFNPKEKQHFLNSDYPDLWLDSFRQSEDAAQRKVIIRERLAADASDGEAPEELVNMFFAAYCERQYRHHCAKVREGELLANQQFDRIMLKNVAFAHVAEVVADLDEEEVIRQYVEDERIKYEKLVHTLQRLHTVISRVEGSQDFSTSDFRRWAHFMVRAEEPEVLHMVDDLNLGAKQEVFHEKVEHYALLAAMAITGVSMLLSVLSLGHIRISESIKTITEESHAGVEAISMLVTGIVLCLKGEKKLGAAYIATGTTLAGVQIASTVSDFGAHFMTATAASASLGFTTGACAFAMALIDERQRQLANKRLNSILQEVDSIDAQLNREQLLRNELFAVTASQVNLGISIDVLEEQVVRRRSYETDLHRCQHNLDLLTQQAGETEQEIRALATEIEKLTHQASDNARRLKGLSSLQTPLLTEPNLRHTLVLQSEEIQTRLDVQRTLLQRKRQEEFDIGQQTLALNARLDDLLQTAESQLPALAVLLHRRDMARAKRIEMAERQEALGQEIEAAILTEPQKQALIKEREELYCIAFHEKAKVATHTLSRNYWIVYGVASVAVATFALLGSVGSLGILPVVSLVSVLIGLGVTYLRHRNLGKNSKAEKLKESKAEISDFNLILKHQDLIKQRLGIDFSKQVKLVEGQAKTLSLKDYLMDKIVHHPDKARAIIVELKKCLEEDMDLADIQETKVGLEQALADKTGKLHFFGESLGLKLFKALERDRDEVLHNEDEDGEGEHPHW